MVPALKHKSLISADKFADAKYTTVITIEKVLVYYGNEVTLRALGQAILKGWRFKTSGLCRVPLKPKVEYYKYTYHSTKPPIHRAIHQGHLRYTHHRTSN